MHQVPLHEYCRRLHSDPLNGITRDEALSRLRRDGPNILIQRHREKEIIKFLRQMANLFALLLWSGAALCLVAEQVAPGEGNSTIALALVCVVVLNGSFSYWQGRRAEEIMASFKELLPHRSRVVRDGIVFDVPACDLVRGDLILLSEGDQVPADARLVDVTALKVDNSSLTGESEPQLRSICPTDKRLLESRNVVFSGTQVMSGEGRGIIFATGMRTQIGRTAELIQTVVTREIPIRREITHFTRIISLIAIVMGMAVLVGSLFLKDAPAITTLIFAVGIIVANVPEGLLPTVTLCLSIAARRMVDNRALVKNLDSVETLGCTTVICTDKTGTLTVNRMTLQRLFLNECVHNESDAGFAREELDAFLQVAVLCNNARATIDGTFTGDPTETALLEFAGRFCSVTEFQKQTRRLFEEPFSSGSKLMITVNQLATGGVVACLKGAPDVAIGMCETILVNGVVQPFEEMHQAAYLNAYEKMAQKGERVLLLAYRMLPHQESWNSELLPKGGYTFVGLAGLFDPPRSEVPQAVASLRQAGLKVVMVTGDYQTTAVAIGRMVGIVTGTAPVVISGEQLRSMSEAHLDWELEQPEIVFARTSPEQKLRIVQALQRHGEVVAVTGDGVNDAPALKQADIGVAMGISGTDVAREAADMVLLDDNFATLLPAVREGRTIFHNLRKSIGFTVTHAVPEVMPYLVFLFCAIPLPLTVTLILSIDLLIDMLPAIALGCEPPEQDIMALPPRSRNERLVGGSLLLRSYLINGLIEAAAGFYAYFTILYSNGWAWGAGLEDADHLHGKAIAGFFTAIVLCQGANAVASRTRSQSLWQQGVLSNPWHMAGVVLALAAAGAIAFISPLQLVFGTSTIGLHDVFIAWPFAVGLFLVDELRRWLIRHNVGWAVRLAG